MTSSRNLIVGAHQLDNQEFDVYSAGIGTPMNMKGNDACYP